MMKKGLGYLFIFAASLFAFNNGKKEGELNCIDFNVLPFITYSITIIVCVTLILLGVALIKNNTSKN